MNSTAAKDFSLEETGNPLFSTAFCVLRAAVIHADNILDEDIEALVEASCGTDCVLCSCGANFHIIVNDDTREKLEEFSITQQFMALIHGVREAGFGILAITDRSTAAT